MRPPEPESLQFVIGIADDELEAFARTHGHEHFREWVGSENYEMRVAPGLRPEWIDRQVLAIVRGQA